MERTTEESGSPNISLVGANRRPYTCVSPTNGMEDSNGVEPCKPRTALEFSTSRDEPTALYGCLPYY